MLTELPPLSPGEAILAERMARRLRGLIEAEGGWLPFSRFMQAALYEPGLGYYMTERPIFGSAGDFATAPELSPLFGACLANGIAGLLEQTGRGDIVEFGAGSGAMAVDLLATLARLDALPRRYRIVEPSPVLASRQRLRFGREAAMASCRDRIEWLDEPPREEWRGVAIANEVIDALPVDRFRIAAGGCESVGVIATPDGFGWRARPAPADLAGAVSRLQQRLPSPMAAGFVSELRLGIGEWISAATRTLAKGALFVSDYGLPRAQYYHASRDGGTLCGFRRHRRVQDVLAHPGAQDLTAWVDFSALAEEAEAAGLAVSGFSTQAHYLLSTGIERELPRIVEDATEIDRARHRQAAATLLLPGEMGERFKVMALTRGIDDPVAGFGFRDLATSL